MMGLIIRFPFYVFGCLVWIFIGGFITILQLGFFPATMLLSAIVPSMWGGMVKKTLSLHTLRKGFRNLNIFLRGY